MRPLISSEIGKGISLKALDDNAPNGQKTRILVKEGGNVPQKVYTFLKVLDQDVQQDKVFREIDGHLLSDVFLKGQNCTIFVYGPTSTGKTYTMQGNAEDLIHEKLVDPYLNSDQVSNGSDNCQ